MKRGIIFEKRENQSIVLADNGRFYVIKSRPDTPVGSRVKFHAHGTRLTVTVLMLLLMTTAFFGGATAMRFVQRNVAAATVRLDMRSSVKLPVTFPSQAASENTLNDNNAAESTAAPKVNAGETITVDCGAPAAELLLNNRGQVLSAAPVNLSGAILLSGVKLEGLTAAQAADKLIGEALDCGFFEFGSDTSAVNAVYIYGASCAKPIGDYTEDAAVEVQKVLQQNYVPAYVLDAAQFTFCGETAVDTAAAGKLIALRAAAQAQHIMDGDTRALDVIMAELTQKGEKHILNVLRSAHIRYGQTLNDNRRAWLGDAKTALKTDGGITFRNYVASSSAAAEYKVWQQSKAGCPDIVQQCEVDSGMPMFIEAFA